MTRLSLLSMLAICSAGVAALYPLPSPGSYAQFVAPRIATAGDIPYPINTTATGMVTLLLRLDAMGKIQNVRVLRDIPPLTSAAQTAVQSWTFTPAALNGNPVPARLSVNVVFNPYDPGGVAIEGLSLPLPPTTPGPNDSELFPAQVTSATFAVYPVNTVASGTVVLNATIGKTGGVEKVRVIRGVPSLTPQCIRAVKSWGFDAATHEGKPVTSHAGVAFVFPSPAVANPG
ncbi:MAG TPA: energy transducer TonB [Candidatus Acidoferrum sp.]|nr:energy transducer TonB [Candidatus Acidoferrum sp.]